MNEARANMSRKAKAYFYLPGTVRVLCHPSSLQIFETMACVSAEYAKQSKRPK